MITSRLLTNYLKKIIPFLSIIKIFKGLWLKCTKHLTIYQGLHLLNFYEKGKWIKVMLTTGPFDTVSDISKERTKLSKVYGTLTWNSLPYHIRNVVSLVMFKYYMRKWKPNNCPYRVCKICLNGVGYTGVS